MNNRQKFLVGVIVACLLALVGRYEWYMYRMAEPGLYTYVVTDVYTEVDRHGTNYFVCRKYLRFDQETCAEVNRLKYRNAVVGEVETPSFPYVPLVTIVHDGLPGGPVEGLSLLVLVLKAAVLVFSGVALISKLLTWASPTRGSESDHGDYY